MRFLLPALPLLIGWIGPASTPPHARPTRTPAPLARATTLAPLDSLRSRLAARIAATPGTDEFFLQNAFESIVDRSVYTLDPKDDSDSSLYALVNQNVSLRELNERMITRSSNLATNALLQLLDPARVTATAHALGARDMQVLRAVEDGKAFEKGLNNTTTARDLGVLLGAIERGRAASRAQCDSMRSVLLRQTSRDEIPAGLPPGTPVAHKTGWITGTLHDAAIVYPKERAPYVLVVLTRKIPRQRDAQALIADISRNVYEYEMKR